MKVKVRYPDAAMRTIELAIEKVETPEEWEASVGLCSGFHFGLSVFVYGMKPVGERYPCGHFVVLRYDLMPDLPTDALEQMIAHGVRRAIENPSSVSLFEIDPGPTFAAVIEGGLYFFKDLP